jgi:hypothetical protein
MLFRIGCGLALLAVAEATPVAAAEGRSIATAEVGADLPKGVVIEGRIVEAVRFRDAGGENLVVFSEGEERETAPDARSQEIFGAQYVLGGERPRRLWLLTDFVRDCGFDVTAGFLPGSMTITDLDADGVAEVTIVYRLACRSDVSPSTQKLIMREGQEKYAIRGTTVIRLDPLALPYGGEIAMDRSFSRAPESFRRFALAEWQRYAEERFSE